MINEKVRLGEDEFERLMKMGSALNSSIPPSTVNLYKKSRTYDLLYGGKSKGRLVFTAMMDDIVLVYTYKNVKALERKYARYLRKQKRGA